MVGRRLVLGVVACALVVSALAPPAAAILERRLVLEERWQSGLDAWTLRGSPGIDCGIAREGCSLRVGASLDETRAERMLDDIPVPLDGKLRASTFFRTSASPANAMFAVSYYIDGVVAGAGIFTYGDGTLNYGQEYTYTWGGYLVRDTLRPLFSLAPDTWIRLVLVLDQATITWEVRDAASDALRWSSLPEPLVRGPWVTDPRPMAPLAGSPVTLDGVAFASQSGPASWFDVFQVELQGETLPDPGGSRRGPTDSPRSRRPHRLADHAGRRELRPFDDGTGRRRHRPALLR